MGNKPAWFRLFITSRDEPLVIDVGAGSFPQLAASNLLVGMVAWSGKGDLNPRPSPWQGDALPLSYSRSVQRDGDRTFY
jgi:hypothetical protein